MPDREKPFSRDEVFPSYWPNRLSAFLSTMEGNFRLRLTNATTIETPAGASEDMVGLGIDGRMRFIEATVQRAHPGGAAGTYDIFATAANPSIASSPAPNTDNTNYAFALAIVATGGTPAIVAGTVDVFRKVGQLEWSGTAITRLTNLINRGRDGDPLYAGNQLVSQSPLIARGIVGQTAPIISAGLATDSDRMTLSGPGQLGLPVAGSGGGILLGGDANLYRSGADILKSDDHVRSAIGFMADTANAQISFRAVQTAATQFLANYLLSGDANSAVRMLGDGKIEWGSGGALAQDTNLYRFAANVLATDDYFLAIGSAATAFTMGSKVAGDSVDRFGVRADGQLEWGSGAVARDTTVARGAARGLVLTDTARASQAGSPAGTDLLLWASGAKGANTTGTTGQTAGLGSGITLKAGDGGDAPVGSTNGAGGDVQVFPGAPGTGAGSVGQPGSLWLGFGFSKLSFFQATPVQRRTGWTAATGTTLRATFDTATVTLPILAQHVKALIDDLIAYGLLGP